MNARIALLAAPLALLAACSDDDPTVYTLSTGTYVVTQPTESPTDQCKLINAYKPDPTTGAVKQIAIAVDGTTANFDLTPGQTVNPALMNPTATINGNSIEQPVEANYVMTWEGSNCSVRVKRTVVGDLTGNDEAALLLHAQIAIEVYGSDCVNDPWNVEGGCQSGIHFLAKKVVQ